MLGHEAVATFGGSREPGPLLIPTQRISLPGIVSQRAADRFRPAVNGAVRLNELHRSFESLARKFRELFSDARVLKRDIFDGVACGLLPAFDPKRAEVAVAVENHQWLRRRRGHMQVAFHGAAGF